MATVLRWCDCGHTEFDHVIGLDRPCTRCSCINPQFSETPPILAVTAVVLEPSGRHWIANLPPNMVGEVMSAVDTDDPAYLVQVEGAKRPGGQLMPTMKLVQYAPHRFVDGNGVEYWIYMRVRTWRP